MFDEDGQYHRGEAPKRQRRDPSPSPSLTDNQLLALVLLVALIVSLLCPS